MSIRSSIKSRLSPATRGILNAIRDELSMLCIHWQGLACSGKFRGQKNLRLNCGCGNHLKAGWVNIDLCKQADLRLDLRRRMPLDDCSVAEIYSEHFMEHLQYPDEVGAFLAESFRVLMPGGKFHLRVPDTSTILTAYLGSDQAYFDINAQFWRGADCKTLMQCLNVQIRGGHKYCYDFETLEVTLLQVGFTSIEKTQFDPALDSEFHKHETLYVRARKPV